MTYVVCAGFAETPPRRRMVFVNVETDKPSSGRLNACSGAGYSLPELSHSATDRTRIERGKWIVKEVSDCSAGIGRIVNDGDHAGGRVLAECFGC